MSDMTPDTMRAPLPEDSVLGELTPLGEANAMAGLVPGMPSRSAQRLALEHAVADTLAHAADLPEVAARIVQVICEALDGCCGSCWIGEPGDPRLRRVGAWVDLGVAIAASTPGPADLDVTDESIALLLEARSRGEPVWVRDRTTETGSWVPMGRPAPACAARLRFPLPTRGRRSA